MIELRECKKLSAKITEQQCERNRSRIVSCLGCPGLGQVEKVETTVKEDFKVSTNKKRYICTVAGCERAQQKNKLCYIHNKEAEAAKHGSFAQDLPVTMEDLERAADEFQEAVIEREVAGSICPSTPLADAVVLYSAGWDLVHDAKASIPKPTGFAALLRLPPPPPEPQAPDGLLIPFTKDEVISLIESAVTLEHIRKFVLMGLEGKVVLADDTDPLAKSRVHAAA